MPTPFFKSAWSTGSNVVKGDIHAGFRDYLALVATGAEAAALTSENQRVIIVDGVPYVYDSADTTSSADGKRVIVSADGKRYKLGSGGPLVLASSSLTINVAAGGSIQAALDAFANFVFIGAATGTVQLAAGTYTISTSLRCKNMQKGKIRVLGASAPSSRPTITSSSATTETNIRNAYATVIESSVGFFSVQQDEGITFQNVAIINTGGAVSGFVATSFGAYVSLNNVSMLGFFNPIALGIGGILSATSVDAVHSQSHGITCVGNTVVNGSDVRSNYNAGSGFNLQYGVRLRLTVSSEAVGNATRGVSLSSACIAEMTSLSCTGNTSDGILVQQQSYMQTLTSTNLSDNGGYAMRCTHTSGITLTSPTVNAAGTGNSKTLLAENNSTHVRAGTAVGLPTYAPAVGAESTSGGWTI